MIIEAGQKKSMKREDCTALLLRKALVRVQQFPYRLEVFCFFCTSKENTIKKFDLLFKKKKEY